jgi:hypothetical protein
MRTLIDVCRLLDEAGRRLADSVNGWLQALPPRALALAEISRPGMTASYRPASMPGDLLAFGDDFWIENARNRRVYLVDGKALRVRDTLLFKDLQSQEHHKLQEKVARVRAYNRFAELSGGAATDQSTNGI